MAYGSWEEIIREYNDIFVNSRIDEHARGILKLIPVIREQIDLTNVIPATSHATLVLQYPAIPLSLRIWCEGDNIYTVYLSHPEQGSSEKITVAMTGIIPVIGNYLRKL